jgi:hypothetical protein
VWLAAHPGDITTDVDATLLNVHSDKQDAASTYKRGYGFHPLGAWCDTTNEPLAAMLRPGNAGSNDTDDHLELLDQALAVLPADYRAGHEPGDDPGLVRHQILLRADSAGATHGFVAGLIEANIEYSIGHPINAAVREGLLLFEEEEWTPAVESDGTVRDGAFVAELTDLMDLSAWGVDARLICRRERPHPGAQLSMFDMSEGWRHTCFITNASALQIDAAVLELRHRGHARVEDRVRSWKDCGLQNLPFASFTRQFIAFAPMWQIYQQFRADEGDTVPATFSRNAIAHTVSPRQFNRRNTVQALLFATSDSLLCFLDEQASRRKPA